MRPEKRYRGWRRSTVFTGEWCGRCSFPQRYEQGQEGQVDWFEAVVKLAGRVAHTAVLQQRKWILSRVQNVCHFSSESVTFNKDCFAESLF